MLSEKNKGRLTAALAADRRNQMTGEHSISMLSVNSEPPQSPSGDLVGELGVRLFIRSCLTPEERQRIDRFDARERERARSSGGTTEDPSFLG